MDKENREKDFEIANQTGELQSQIEENRLDQERKIEDRRRASEAKAHEDQQINTVLANVRLNQSYGTFLC
jgi:hypothetical protein